MCLDLLCESDLSCSRRVDVFCASSILSCGSSFLSGLLCVMCCLSLCRRRSQTSDEELPLCARRPPHHYVPRLSEHARWPLSHMKVCCLMHLPVCLQVARLEKELHLEQALSSHSPPSLPPFCIRLLSAHLAPCKRMNQAVDSPSTHTTAWQTKAAHSGMDRDRLARDVANFAQQALTITHKHQPNQQC